MIGHESGRQGDAGDEIIGPPGVVVGGRHQEVVKSGAVAGLEQQFGPLAVECKHPRRHLLERRCQGRADRPSRMHDLPRHEFHALLAADTMQHAGGERIHEGQRRACLDAQLRFERVVVLHPYPDHVGQTVADDRCGEHLGFQPAAGRAVGRGEHHDQMLVSIPCLGDSRGEVGRPRKRFGSRQPCLDHDDRQQSGGRYEEAGGVETGGWHGVDYGSRASEMPGWDATARRDRSGSAVGRAVLLQDGGF